MPAAVERKLFGFRACFPNPGDGASHQLIRDLAFLIVTTDEMAAGTRRYGEKYIHII
jgi:hypothetical protein